MKKLCGLENWKFAHVLLGTLSPLYKSFSKIWGSRATTILTVQKVQKVWLFTQVEWSLNNTSFTHLPFLYWWLYVIYWYYMASCKYCTTVQYSSVQYFHILHSHVIMDQFLITFSILACLILVRFQKFKNWQVAN